MKFFSISMSITNAIVLLCYVSFNETRISAMVQQIQDLTEINIKFADHLLKPVSAIDYDIKKI